MIVSSFLGSSALHGCLFLGFLLFLLPVVLDNVEQVVNGAVPLLASQVNRVLELDCGLLLADVEEKSPLDEADRLL